MLISLLPGSPMHSSTRGGSATVLSVTSTKNRIGRQLVYKLKFQVTKTLVAC
jgi:hypothetical protein